MIALKLACDGDFSSIWPTYHFIVQQDGTGLIKTYILYENSFMELKIAYVLKKIMETDRHTITSISKATGVPKSNLSEWLNNRSPNPVQAAKVANYLKISFHYLLFDQEDSQEPLQKIIKDDFFSGTFEINIKRIKYKKELET